MNETIFALATPPGRGALAIVRVSGENSTQILEGLLLRPERIVSRPREQHYVVLRHEKEQIDTALVTYFRAPHSFTGEDSIEFTVHGAPVVIKQLSEALRSLGARMARGGEFTERAFINGKLDLVQAEAVGDLIHSETESQAKLAKQQLDGVLSSRFIKLAEPMRNLLAEMEAYIDFPEEEIEPLHLSKWKEEIQKIQSTIDRYIGGFKYGKLVREGAHLALCGLPNVGKSSLMNALLSEDRVIVSDIPGTTRDSITEAINLDGFLVHLVDTAGIVVSGEREVDTVESLGIERSWEHVKSADAVLFLIDLTQEKEPQNALLCEVLETNPNTLIAFTKSDLHEYDVEKEGISISVSDAESIGNLRRILRDTLVSEAEIGSALLVAERHRNLLEDARNALKNGVLALENGEPQECVSFELREALKALDDIIGPTHIEDVLGRIFSKFCIGK